MPWPEVNAETECGFTYISIYMIGVVTDEEKDKVYRQLCQACGDEAASDEA